MSKPSSQPDEPSGLAAHAAALPAARPLIAVDHRHQQAVENIATARNLSNAGRHEEAKKHLHAAAALEREVLATLHRQPERAIVAETGATAALQAGKFLLASELCRLGLEGSPPPHLSWFLERALMQAAVLRTLDADCGGGWVVDWSKSEEQEAPDLVVARAGLTLQIEMADGRASTQWVSSSSSTLCLLVPQNPEPRELSREVRAWSEPTFEVLREQGTLEEFVRVASAA